MRCLPLDFCPPPRCGLAAYLHRLSGLTAYLHRLSSKTSSLRSCCLLAPPIHLIPIVHQPSVTGHGALFECCAPVMWCRALKVHLGGRGALFEHTLHQSCHLDSILMRGVAVFCHAQVGACWCMFFSWFHVSNTVRLRIRTGMHGPVHDAVEKVQRRNRLKQSDDLRLALLADSTYRRGGRG